VLKVSPLLISDAMVFHVMNFHSIFFVWLSYSNSGWNTNHPLFWCKNVSCLVVILSKRHMPYFWTDSLPFPRNWPPGLSFLYFQDNSNWTQQIQWTICSTITWLLSPKISSNQIWVAGHFEEPLTYTIIHSLYYFYF
jgi:hypothetical protein